MAKFHIGFGIKSTQTICSFKLQSARD